jgi:hypothetical protein
MAQITARTTGTLVEIHVTSGGDSYTSAPSVVIAGFGGTGATATAHMAGTVVERVVVGNAGTGFTSSPTISFSGGGGAGAAATAYAYTDTLSPVCMFRGRYNDVYGVDGMGRGFRYDGTTVTPIGLAKPAIGPALTASTTATYYVKSVELVVGGAGYYKPPTIVIGGTAGTTATALAGVANGRVSAITLTEKGAGYTGTPTVTLTGGIGAGAVFGVGINGGVDQIVVTNKGTGYTASRTAGGSTFPTVVMNNLQGLTSVAGIVSVNEFGEISDVRILSGGTACTGTGVTASITGGAGTGALLDVKMAYRVDSVTATAAGTGYYAAPYVSFTAATDDPNGSGAAATAYVNSTGSVTGVTVLEGGRYSNRPTATVLDTTAKAMANISAQVQGIYQCCFRYIDATPVDQGGPRASSISFIKELDASTGCGSITWTFDHTGREARASKMEIWRTTAGQQVVLFLVTTLDATTSTYVDTLSDAQLSDPTRVGYAVMPVTMPSGQINARRFEIPPGEFPIACMFQDRAWMTGDTTGKRPNALLYSEVDEPESMPDENEIVLQENTGEPDKNVALVPFGTQLLIVQSRHIYSLTYVSQPVIDAAVRLVGYRGILNMACWDMMGGVVFIADSYGLYAFDGNQEQAVSAPVDDLWRDGTIDFSQASKFFVQCDMAQKVVRFYYCESGDSDTVRAVCYSIATKAWWHELYPVAVTAGVHALRGNFLDSIYGRSTGTLVRSAGLHDESTPIPYSLRMGPRPFANEKGGIETSRSVTVIYNPTVSSEALDLRLHFNNSATARTNAIASNPGTGFITTTGSTGATLDMAIARSPLGSAVGQARAEFSGRVDLRSAGGDKHVAIAVTGQQTGTTTGDGIAFHSIAIEGVS